MNKLIIVIFFTVVSFAVSAQRTSVEEYIEQFRETAMNEMKRSGVPASITLAQGILESESGNSELVKRSNNHFGIKCKSSWSGESVKHDDDARGECFRAYTDANESYRDHSDFLRVNKRYSALFSLDPADYEGWAKGLKKAGYATNPRYPDLLIKYVEQYNLQQYSLAVINKLPAMDIAKNIDDKENIVPVEIKNEIPVVDNNNMQVEPAMVSAINKTKCVYVKKGTSLLVVANNNNISLSKLMEFNDMTEEGIISKDQYIFLHKKPKTGEKEFYIVERGETLLEVAQKNGIQLKYLLEYNNLNSTAKLNADTKLYLQPIVKTADNTGEVKKGRVHLVSPKEGLYAIARKYKVTVQQLKEWNNLESDDLKIGQEIIVTK